LVKQIRNGELTEALLKRGDGYFYWLQKVSGLSGPLASMLAETKFVSSVKEDDILIEKAKEEVRRNYAETILSEDEYNDKNVETIFKSIRGDCCLFEIMVCLAVSINEMFEDTAAYDGPSHFFGILLRNAGLDIYDDEDWDLHEEKVKAYWESRIRIILERSYEKDGKGGLFSLCDDLGCIRSGIPLWKQMNIWVDQHTNEDGEWVD